MDNFFHGYRTGIWTTSSYITFSKSQIVWDTYGLLIVLKAGVDRGRNTSRGPNFLNTVVYILPLFEKNLWYALEGDLGSKYSELFLTWGKRFYWIAIQSFDNVKIMLTSQNDVKFRKYDVLENLALSV